MITNQDRANVRRIFEKVRDDTAKSVAKKVAETGTETHPQIASIIAAQNALRICMEVVFNDCLPYDDAFLSEMAVRLATYAISAGPVEDHQRMLSAVITSMPDALARRVASGVVIRTRWMTDGVDRPNIPAKEDIQ